MITITCDYSDNFDRLIMLAGAGGFRVKIGRESSFLDTLAVCHVPASL